VRVIQPRTSYEGHVYVGSIVLRSIENSPHGCLEDLGVKGSRQERRAEIGKGHLGLVRPRHHENLYPGSLLDEQRTKISACKSRHVHIGDDEINGTGIHSGQIECLLTIRSGEHEVSFLLEQHDDHVADHHFLVSKECDDLLCAKKWKIGKAGGESASAVLVVLRDREMSHFVFLPARAVATEGKRDASPRDLVLATQILTDLRLRPLFTIAHPAHFVDAGKRAALGCAEPFESAIIRLLMAATKKTNVGPVFDPKVFLAKASDGTTIVKCRNREKVFAQGDPADAVYYINSGKVKLNVVSHQGKEAVVAILGTGDFFGEGCLAGQTLRMASAIALSDCSIMRLAKNEMIRVLREEPSFSEMFLAHMLTHNIKIEEDLVDHLFNSSEKRLARVLLLMANFGKPGQPEIVIPKISQETLAEIVGTTRSRVSFFMNRFRKLGFVEYSGGSLAVHSSLLTIVLHD